MNHQHDVRAIAQRAIEWIEAGVADLPLAERRQVYRLIGQALRDLVHATRPERQAAKAPNIDHAKVELVLASIRIAPESRIQETLERADLTKAELFALADLMAATVSSKDSKPTLIERLRHAEICHRTMVGLLDGATP